MIKNRELIEYAQYDGNFYGTPRAFVEQKLCEGFHVILEIEVQGAAQVRTLYPEAVSVFVMPPSCRELRKRLTGRATESAQHVQERLDAAMHEIASAKDYDFVIVNDDLESARAQLLCAVSAGSLLARIKAKLIDEVLNDAQTSFK
jgi:guanylate kinase